LAGLEDRPDYPKEKPWYFRPERDSLVDYNIVSNYSLQDHHYDAPEKRPDCKEFVVSLILLSYLIFIFHFRSKFQKTKTKISRITTLFQTNISNITMQKSSPMKKFKKLKLLIVTGKPMISISSTESILMLLKKPNSNKRDSMKPKSTDKTKSTNYL
jgi:hypothetical protein